jgi:hypothetical protein
VTAVLYVSVGDRVRGGETVIARLPRAVVRNTEN